MALVVAMGIGRFVYTPLLPEMQEQFHFNDEIAGVIASVNYLGYLLGALLCFKTMTPKIKLLAIRMALVLSVSTTAFMGFATTVNCWIIIRFISGLASAGVFIIGSSIIMDKLSRSDNSHDSILMYSGVGFGIAFTGIMSPVLISFFSAQTTWIIFALICVPLILFCWVLMIPLPLKVRIKSNFKDKPKLDDSRLLPWLAAAYFCEGFGYIISGTFIVSFLKDQAGFFSSGPFAWTIIGLTASMSIPIFFQLSKRIHIIKVLIVAHFIQGIGIVIPVLSSHWLSICCGAILFGGTFMGITALSLSLGKALKPDQGQWVIGFLTAVYGVGQILGPLVSGMLSNKTGNIVYTMILSSIVVIGGGFLLTAGLVLKKYANPIQRSL